MPSNEHKRAIGLRLKKLRGAETQAAFAARLGTSSGRLSDLESGMSAPNAEFLGKLNEELGVDLNWLLTGNPGTGAVAITATEPLPRDEADLLALYRASSPAGKTAIRATSAAVEKSAVGATRGARKKRVS